MTNIELYKQNGVTFIDESNVYIDCDVKIGKGTVIEPNVRITGSTVIGENVQIGFCSDIADCIIENSVTVKHSVLTKSHIGEGTVIGPFAYIRPDCNVGKNVKIGDFVEIKNSSIGDGTKLAHLTYVGDADVGSNINFGCGTVVVNYDGKSKHRTVIEDNAFIGCNTNLVSPVRVGKNAYTAAGSTITDDVPENSLAIAREKQTNKEDWVLKKALKK